MSLHELLVKSSQAHASAHSLQLLRQIPSYVRACKTGTLDEAMVNQIMCLYNSLRFNVPSDTDVRKRRRKRGDVIDSDSVYGEATPIFAKFLADKISANQTFLDIGSGTGNLMMLIAALSRANVVGIEYDAFLHEECQKNRLTFIDTFAKYGIPHGSITCIGADATALEHLAIPPILADVVFVNNFVMTAGLIERMLKSALVAKAVKPTLTLYVMKALRFPRVETADDNLRLYLTEMPTYYVLPNDSFTWASTQYRVKVYKFDFSLDPAVPRSSTPSKLQLKIFTAESDVEGPVKQK